MNLNTGKPNSTAMEAEREQLAAEIKTMTPDELPAMALRLQMASLAVQIELLRRVENNVRN